MPSNWAIVTWAGKATFLHFLLGWKAVAAPSLWSFDTGQVLHHTSPNRQKSSVRNEEGKGILKAHGVLRKLSVPSSPLLHLGSFNRSSCVQAVISHTFICWVIALGVFSWALKINLFGGGKLNLHGHVRQAEASEHERTSGESQNHGFHGNV